MARWVFLLLKTSNNEMKPKGANITITSGTRNKIPERACVVLDEPVEKEKESQDAEEEQGKREIKRDLAFER